MSAEQGKRSTRTSSKDKQDQPAKDEKPSGSGKSTDPSSNVKELETKTTPEFKLDPNVYQVVFYMKHFRPTDILVRVVGRTLHIDACHREHADEHGLVSRSIVRKHKLPKDVKMETLSSSFTCNGFLVIHAEREKEKTEQN